jgi:hypothetical protein
MAARKQFGVVVGLRVVFKGGGCPMSGGSLISESFSGLARRCSTARGVLFIGVRVEVENAPPPRQAVAPTSLILSSRSKSTSKLERDLDHVVFSDRFESNLTRSGASRVEVALKTNIFSIC